MRSLIMILTLLIALPAFSQRRTIDTVKKLTYRGYYSAWGGFIKSPTAGYVEFTIDDSNKYPNSQRIMAVGHTDKKFDYIFKLRDTLISYHDKDTYKPYEFSRKAHEGNYHKTFDYVFDYNNNIINADINRIGKYQRKDTIDILPNTFDMLSVAWHARQLDFDSYKKNDLIPIRILLDDKVYDLHIRYLGKEKVSTDGGRKQCHVFSPLLVEGDVFKGGENMKVWVSDDDYRIPVLVEAKILVGKVKGELWESKSDF